MALERCRRDSAWSGQTIGYLAGKYELSPRQTAYAYRLFYGVLQNLALCDYYIGCFAKGKLEPKVRDILRLGVYQILFMDGTPDSAAVNEAVKQCRSGGYARAAGLVNAVLRRVSGQKDALPPIPGEGTAQYLSLRYSHPLWLAEELVALRGYEDAERVLQADNGEPPVYVWPNTCRVTAEQLGEMLPVCAAPNGLILERSGDFTATDAFSQGLFYVQDPAAHDAVTAAELSPGMRVLDACAAPGGKSFAAAIAMGNTGSVTARDIMEKKLKLVAEGAARMGLSCIRCEPGDARDIAGGDYDAVFADVPCSGLGVIRRKPEIRFRDPAQLASLPELQAELLEAVSRAVRPGGRLIYSTCTWRAEENGGVTGPFLQAHPEFEKISERTYWPGTDGTDGFYICRMDRVKRI